MAWFGKSSKEDIVSIEEQKIKEMIVSILKKENTKVNMAPLSKKYFIINKDIELNILVDGGAELVKTANHKFKYGWKFRGDFINQMIDLVIEWIENDRAKIESDIFVNEINLLNDINGLINTLPDFEKEIPEKVKRRSVI
jgi:hypothetical protein